MTQREVELVDRLIKYRIAKQLLITIMDDPVKAEEAEQLAQEIKNELED